MICMFFTLLTKWQTLAKAMLQCIHSQEVQFWNCSTCFCFEPILVFCPFPLQNTEDYNHHCGNWPPSSQWWSVMYSSSAWLFSLLGLVAVSAIWMEVGCVAPWFWWHQYSKRQMGMKHPNLRCCQNCDACHHKLGGEHWYGKWNATNFSNSHMQRHHVGKLSQSCKVQKPLSGTHLQFHWLCQCLESKNWLTTIFVMVVQLCSQVWLGYPHC